MFSGNQSGSSSRNMITMLQEYFSLGRGETHSAQNQAPVEQTIYEKFAYLIEKGNLVDNGNAIEELLFNDTQISFPNFFAYAIYNKSIPAISYLLNHKKNTHPDTFILFAGITVIER